MWNKSISLPVKKMDPTINDNGITMEETYKFIGGIPADFRDSTRDDEVLAKQNGYTNIEHFTDDGYSGGSFDRPDWKRMVAGIEDGSIGTVIVKDMSRIGRDYLQVGFYTEVMFKEKEVHFIAIANGVDNQKRESSEFAPFLNIMNEWYIRDSSRKVTTVLRARGMEGKHTTNNAIYGYRKKVRKIIRKYGRSR